MNAGLLLDLTIRGSLLFGVTVAADFALASKMGARGRRVWWLLVPLGFLIPVRFTPEWLTQAPSTPDLANLSGHVLLNVPALKSAWTGTPAASLIEGGASWISLVWLIGAVIGALRVLVPTWRAHRQWTSRRLCTDSALVALLEDAKAAARVTAPIGLVLADDIPAPALLGWLRPRILLPSALAAAPGLQLRGVLLHELAHFRNLDIPLNWLFAAVRVVHWFNPVAWWAGAAWSRFREEAADECAIPWLREPAAATIYGDILLQTLGRCAGGEPPCGALAIGESIHHLERRILMIRNDPRKSNRILTAALVTAILGALVVLAPVAVGDDSQETGKKEAEAAMDTWLGQMDAGNFAASWDDASTVFRKAVTKDKWVSVSGSVRTPLGQLLTRHLASAALQSGDLGAGLKGTYVVAQYDTSFENLQSARETVTFQKEDDGAWRVAGYYFKPR